MELVTDLYLYFELLGICIFVFVFGTLRMELVTVLYLCFQFLWYLYLYLGH